MKSLMAARRYPPARIHLSPSSSGSNAGISSSPREHPPHAQEVDRLGDVVDADDGRAGVRRPPDGGERPAQPGGRRAARDRAEEVLARDGEQQRLAERRDAVDRAQHLDRLGRRLGEVRAGVEDELLVGDAGGARGLAALAQERDDVADDVAAVVGEALLLRRRARVHDDERRPGARAQLREPDVGQPARVVDHRRARVEHGRRDRRLPRVDRDRDALAREPLDERHDALRSRPPPRSPACTSRPTRRRRRRCRRPRRRAGARARPAPRASSGAPRPRTSPARR